MISSFRNALQSCALVNSARLSQGIGRDWAIGDKKENGAARSAALSLRCKMRAESPALSGRAIPLAKERALDVNIKQWGIDPSALNQPGTEEDATFDRAPTEAEIWSLFRLTSKLSDSVDISAYLETLGYSKGLIRELAKKIASARSGSLEKPDWVNAESEAATLREKAKQTEKRSAQLIEEANILKGKIENELGANLATSQDEKKSAEAAANSVCNPFHYRAVIFSVALKSQEKCDIVLCSGDGCPSAEPSTISPRQRMPSLPFWMK
jgi:hypothetical protein